MSIRSRCQLACNLRCLDSSQVGEAELYINRRLAFGERVPESSSDNETDDFETMRVAPDAQTKVATDAQIATKEIWQALASIRKAGWVVVCLLTLIFIDLILKR